MLQAEKKQSVERELNLTTVAQMLWKRIWVIVACGVVAAVLFFVYTLCFVTPRYAAKVTLYANNRYSSQGSTSISTSDMNASAQLVDVYAAIILSDPVLDHVIAENQLKFTAEALAKFISVNSVNGTEVFQIQVISPKPELAAKVANSIANIAPEKISQIIDGCSVKLISEAKVPIDPITPDYVVSVQNGFLTGVLISVLFFVVVALLDTRIKNEDDLNGWDLPIIGVVPSFEEAERSSGYRYRAKGDEN